MPELSVIIPVMNEEENIISLAEKIRQSLADIDHEVIWVNDGSSDKTSDKIRESAEVHTVLIELKKNYGQSAALLAGIRAANSNYISFIDGDGQNDPDDLPGMLAMLKHEDCDMVAGERTLRKDNTIRKIPSLIANWLIRTVSGTKLRDLGCSTRVIKKKWALSLPLEKGMHRYINVIMARKNAKILQVGVRHHARIAGKSKYGLGRIIPVLADLLKVINISTIGDSPFLPTPYEISNYWKPSES
jgi:glycosyltransferase involved in cell wall biosynthesis